MKIMDRYLLVNFVAAFCICYISLVGLYIVIDLFSNADEFLEDGPDTITFVRRVSTYYMVHSFEYFAKLSPIITQIAAMTTLAALHRHNEIVALLAAGIPTMRALVPILAGVMGVISLGVVNREVMLPEVNELLQRNHEDIDGKLALLPGTRFDEDLVLFRATEAHRENQRLEKVTLTLPRGLLTQPVELMSSRAFFKTDEETGREGWHLVKPKHKYHGTWPEDKVKELPNGDLFLFSSLTFADVTRNKHWADYASTTELLEEMHNDMVVKDPHQIRMQIHRRLMQPVLNLLLVLIGVPFVLTWERKHIYRSIAVSMVLSAVFFTVDGTASYFATHHYLDAMTAAWVPVFIFGPISLAMFHRIGT